MSDYTKRVAETISIEADFGSRIPANEALVSVLCEAFQHDADSIIEDYSLADVDEVIFQEKSGSVIVFSKSYPATGMNTARLVLAVGNIAAPGIIDSATVDEDGYALEVDRAVVTIRAQAGESGSTYRIRFTATTDQGHVLVEEKTMDVVP